MQVLLDGGSSDNFIQPRLAHNFQLPMEPAGDVKVMVGNEHYLHAEGVVRDLPLTISGQTIHFPSYVLPVSSAEVVLRASWLATLGAHIADYSSASIKFYLDYAFVTLQGDTSYCPSVVQFHHLKRYYANHAIAELYTLSCSPHDSSVAHSMDLSADLHLDLVAIIRQFFMVFYVPKGLPPPHTQDHSIPLQDGVSAIRVKRYRYPFSQKTQIERMVEEMLDEGLI